ncbi:MAG: YncE family protein [Anaerolineae bacterium]
MGLVHLGYIDLPAHAKPGGFDHAAIHRGKSRLYVAHTANDALDVIDCARDVYLYSMPGLAGVAGALVSDERNRVFTSNRGENSVGIFSPDNEENIAKVSVGIRPNGLAYDPMREILLAANVGDPAIPDSFTLSLVDVRNKRLLSSVPVPSRTRWTIWNPQTDSFYVNIADPAQIVVIRAAEPNRVTRVIPVPASGPHGLDLDGANRRLFCACDGGKLVVLDITTGTILDMLDLSGVPDVIFFNPGLKHLYVAIGDPGVIEVFDTESMSRIEALPTEKGAHTIALDLDRNKVYAFLPQTHRAAFYQDGGEHSHSFVNFPKET